MACRAQEIIEAATNAGLLRLVAELPVRDQIRQISFDPSAGVWAAFLHSRAILEVTHLLVGTFSAQPPALTLVKEFEVGENANVHCLLPDGQGVLCGNKDGTILWFGPPADKNEREVQSDKGASSEPRLAVHRRGTGAGSCSTVVDPCGTPAATASAVVWK